MCVETIQKNIIRLHQDVLRSRLSSCCLPIGNFFFNTFSTHLYIISD